MGGTNIRIVIYGTELDENKHTILVKKKSCNYLVESLSNSQTITEMLNGVFKLNKQAEEYVYMIALNAKCKPLGVFEISHGTVDQSVCNPRDIFMRALLCGASGVVLAHNHPSGDTRPSKEDVTTYNRIKEAGKLIGIEVLDNIIVGDGYFSFTEGGL